MRTALCFAILSLLVVSRPAAADEATYGVVTYFDGHRAGVRTATFEGHWQVDGATTITGPVQVNDWVYVNVASSGHIRVLRSEEHATQMTGVVRGVNGNVLVFASGNATQSWNIAPTTGFAGTVRGQVAIGDELRLAVYRNHNIASLTFIRHV